MFRFDPLDIAALQEALQPDRIADLDPKVQERLKKLLDRLSGDSVTEVFIDGAADRHSRTAGIGGVFYRNGEELATFSEQLPGATNNEAEYQALVHALNLACQLNIHDLKIYSDSELIVRQINGSYKVKNERMKRYHAQVMKMLSEMNSWSIKHIPRTKNKVADRLSKAGMEQNRQDQRKSNS
jgi:ribonuclease HI